MSFPYLKDQQPSALIQTHVVALIENFDRYFPTERYAILNDKRWMQNPFEFESPEALLELTLGPAEETELLQLSCDSTDAMDL